MRSKLISLTRRHLLNTGAASFASLCALGVARTSAQPNGGFICATLVPQGAQLETQGTSEFPTLETGEASVNVAELSPQGVAYARRRWRPQHGLDAPAGHIRLGVAFVDEDEGRWRDEVIRRASRWTDTSHPLGAKLARRLSFDFSVSEENAQIRVGRGGSGGRPRHNKSFVGSDSLRNRVEDGRSTMLITDMRSVEHEFGHALCLGHEHRHEEMPVEIDPERAIEYYHRHFGWDADKTITNVLTNAPSCLGDQFFNPASVMLYSIAAEITKDGTSLARFNDIHERDRACLNHIYGAS